jgi:hypothetical protein
MIWTFDQEVSNRGPPAGMRRFGNVAFFSRRPKQPRASVADLAAGNPVWCRDSEIPSLASRASSELMFRNRRQPRPRLIQRSSTRFTPSSCISGGLGYPLLPEPASTPR